MKEELKEIKTATITEKGQICIPNIARVNGFKEGSKITILVYPDKIELRPMKQITEDMLPMLISEEALAESWNTPEEDEIWKNL